MGVASCTVSPRMTRAAPSLNMFLVGMCGGDTARVWIFPMGCAVVIRVAVRSREKPLGYENGQYAGPSAFYLSISIN